MHLPAALLFVVIAAVPAAVQAAPRVAVVRVADVYKGLDSSRKNEDSTKADLENLQTDRRAQEVIKSREALKAQAAALPANPATPEELAKLTADERAKLLAYALRYREVNSLQEEFNAYFEQEAKKINTRKVQETRAILGNIIETAQKIGKEQGFDWVFDTSGNTNSTIPLVIYAKAPADLTEQVLNALQSQKPAAPPAAPGSDKAPANPER